MSSHPKEISIMVIAFSDVMKNIYAKQEIVAKL